MVGVFDSGRSVVFQMSSRVFHDLLVDHLRRDVSLVSAAFPFYPSNFGRWPDPNVIQPTAELPSWALYPPSFPVADLATGQRQQWLKLNEPPFLNSLIPATGALSDIDIKVPDTWSVDDIQVGYGSIDSAPQWEAFEAPLRQDGAGHDWDWAIAIDARKMQGILDSIAAAVPTIHSLGLALDSVGLHFAQFFYTSLAFHWGAPIGFTGSGAVVIDQGQSSIDFRGHAAFSFSADGILHLILAIDDISTDFWEHPFGSGFSDTDRDGTSDAITRDIFSASQRVFGTVPGGTRDSLGPVESRISDGARLLGRGLEQTADGLRVFGDASIQMPGFPRISPPYGTTLTVYEDPASACAGGEPRFNLPPLTIRNVGDGPMTVSGIELDPRLALQPWPAFPFSLWPGEESRFSLRITSAISRGQTARLTMRFFSNGFDYPRLDELLRNRPRPPLADFEGREERAFEEAQASWDLSWDRVFREEYFLHLVPGAPVPFRVYPENGVEVLRANSHSGSPRQRLANCHPIQVRDPAAEITILNDSQERGLYLCSAVLQDPAGVFEVPFSPVMIAPVQQRPPSSTVPAIFLPPWERGSGETQLPVYFYPTQAMVDYRATFIIETSAGQIVVPIHGRVEALPQFGDRGEWVDLNAGEICAPANVMCKLGGLFEPLDAMAGDRAIFRVSVDGAPRDSELVIGDRAGNPAVRDVSGDPSRGHDLAFTPLPDGQFAPGDPCAISVHNPDSGEEIGLGDLLRADLTGQVIRPAGGIDGFAESGALAVAGGWVYAATPSGIQMIDWRDPANPLLGASIALLQVRALGLTAGELFVVAGEELVMFDLAKPDNPVRRAEFRLGGQTRALAAGEGAVHVADGAGVASFRVEEGRLVPRGRVDLPLGAESIALRRGAICALGREHLTLLAIDKGESMRLADSIKFELTGATLGNYGRNLLISNSKGSLLLRPEGSSRLRELARYSRPHWSNGFISDPTRGGLLRRAEGGRLEMWSIRRRDIDLAQFKDALELRYKPQRRATRRDAPNPAAEGPSDRTAPPRPSFPHLRRPGASGFPRSRQ